jgi:hypothetical protein
MLRSSPTLSRVAAFALTLLLAHSGSGAEAVNDPAITTFGTLNPAAPAELATFSFLVGKWTGIGKYRDAEGKVTEFEVVWVGRYVLNGMAIADEMRRPDTAGGTVDGMGLRFFDTTSKTWTIEFLNFVQGFVRKQVNAEVGAVKQDGNRITIEQSGPGGAPGREVYTLVDANHFTYSLDVSKPGGGWDEGGVTMQLERKE